MGKFIETAKSSPSKASIDLDKFAPVYMPMKFKIVFNSVLKRVESMFIVKSVDQLHIAVYIMLIRS